MGTYCYSRGLDRLPGVFAFIRTVGPFPRFCLLLIKHFLGIRDWGGVEVILSGGGRTFEDRGGRWSLRMSANSTMVTIHPVRSPI